MRAFPEYRRVATFADTDMAGVVHFSNVLRYVEEAEHAGFRMLEFEVITKNLGFPRVRVECDYLAPIRFGDEVLVRLAVHEVGERKILWHFVVTVAEVVVAKGVVVTVCVGADGRAQKMPADCMRALAGMLG